MFHDGVGSVAVASRLQLRHIIDKKYCIANMSFLMETDERITVGVRVFVGMNVVKIVCCTIDASHSLV